jgi:hypothetical protein
MVDFAPPHAVIVEAGSIAEDVTQTDLPPGGWYGDPASSEPLRYWNGRVWADGETDPPPSRGAR